MILPCTKAWAFDIPPLRFYSAETINNKLKEIFQIQIGSNGSADIHKSFYIFVLSFAHVYMFPISASGFVNVAAMRERRALLTDSESVK